MSRTPRRVGGEGRASFGGGGGWTTVWRVQVDADAIAGVGSECGVRREQRGLDGIRVEMRAARAGDRERSSEMKVIILSTSKCGESSSLVRVLSSTVASDDLLPANVALCRDGPDRIHFGWAHHRGSRAACAQLYTTGSVIRRTARPDLSARPRQMSSEPSVPAPPPLPAL